MWAGEGLGNLKKSTVTRVDGNTDVSAAQNRREAPTLAASVLPTKQALPQGSEGPSVPDASSSRGWHLLAPVHASASIRMRVRVLLSLSPLCDIFHPSSVSLCPQDSPPPTDTVPDNYSLLILPVLAAPGAVFFILAGHLLVHHSLCFSGGKVLRVPIRRERALLHRPEAWGLSQWWAWPPPPVAALPAPPLPPQGLEGLAKGTLEIRIRAVNVYRHLPHAGRVSSAVPRHSLHILPNPSYSSLHGTLAQRGSGLARSHTATERRSWDLHPKPVHTDPQLSLKSSRTNNVGEADGVRERENAP